MKLNLTRKSKELFQISLEKKREANGRGLQMAVLKENQNGHLKIIPKVIREIQEVIIKTPKQSLEMKPGRSC